MSLIENTFINQASVPDVNGGAAEANATGGAAAVDPKNSALSKSLDSATNAISESLSKKPGGTLFEDGKFVFPDNLLKEFKMDSLVGGIDEAISNGASVPDALSNGVNNFVNDHITQMKMDASDTWAYLQMAGGNFLTNILGKLKGLLLSRIYVSDIVFLAGLGPIGLTGSLVDYKDNYVRKLCLKHDMPLSLKYVDNRLGVRYTVDNNKALNDATKAAKYGSIEVCFYIIGELYKELIDLKNCYPLPRNYDRKSQESNKKAMENQVEDFKRLLSTYEEGTPLYIALQLRIADYQSKIDGMFINKEDKYLEDPAYLKIQSLITKSRKMIHKIMKYVITYSYSNLHCGKIREVSKKYDLNASAFGTTDKEFGKAALINSSDINVIAPIVKPDKNKTLTGSVNDFTKSNGIVPDTDIKFITLRNVNIKSIYVSLASKNINNMNMVNKPLYERLKMPVYSTVISGVDSALSGLLKVGIGKTVVGALNSIEEAFYVYGKSLEPYLYNASKVQYISYNDLSSLPDPDDVESKSDKKGSNGREDIKDSGAADPGKNSTGDPAPPEISSTDKIVESMTMADLDKFIMKHTDLTEKDLSEMTYEAKVILAKKIIADKGISSDDLIDDLSEESLKDYIENNDPSINPGDLDGMTEEELKDIVKETNKAYELDLNSHPVDHMSIESIKQYLKNHFGYKESVMHKESDTWIKARFKREITPTRKIIYYPKSVNTNTKFKSYDAEGFPIMGYPDEKTLTDAVNKNQIGYFSKTNRNAFPITSTAHICPIIGYDCYGKAMYGVPIFYPESDPICTDFRGIAVFNYVRDVSPLEEINSTESEVRKNVDDNNKEIANINQYIANGASGVLKLRYDNQLTNLKNENKILNDLLDTIKIKPVTGYNELGDPVFSIINPLYDVTTPDNIKCLGYDQDGKPIYEINDKGKTIIGYRANNGLSYGTRLLTPIGKDKDDQVIYGYDSDNKPIYGFTSSGTPVISITYDNKGKIVSYKESDKQKKNVIGRTEDGEDIYYYNNNGSPIISYDEDNNGIVKVDNKEINMKLTNVDSKIYELTVSSSSYIIEYVLLKFPDYSNDDALKYILEHGLEKVYNDYLNDTEIDKSALNISGEMIARYISEINSAKSEMNIYERILNEVPTPPVIGFDSNNVPILGKALIHVTIDDLPTIKYSNKTGMDYGMVLTQDSLKDGNQTSILDKPDFDIDKSFKAVEREIIAMDNGAQNNGLVLKAIYMPKDPEM
ncbi:MAG: hypothetical protein ACRC5M_06830 [Anaeroplasmataceae bacterium]